MDAIFRLLEQHRLEAYYNQFIQMGVKDERDFLDGVSDDDLTKLGFSHVEKNRFSAMKNFIQRLRAPKLQVQVQKPMQSFSLQYTYPKCPEPKSIMDLDPGHNTVEDLMLRICHLENIGNSKGVCLYTVDGMPLTDDPFFNTWSLKDRYIENGAVIYAMFTPKENFEEAPKMQPQEFGESSGGVIIRCHIMLKGDYELMVNLKNDTITSLTVKLANASGVPWHVLHYTGEQGDDKTLQAHGISEGSLVSFSLSTFSCMPTYCDAFYISDVEPSVQQTQKGMSVFLSSVYVIKSHQSKALKNKLVAYIRKLTGCNPLAQSLHQLLCRNERITRHQKIAVVEGLYMLFRKLLPQLSEVATPQSAKVIKDLDVFENSLCCWAHLISEAKHQQSGHENYAPISLLSEGGSRFCEPVRVPGVPGVLERAYVLQKIKDGEKIPNCTEKILRESSLQRATDIEKVLLSLPPFVRTYPLWIDHDKTTGLNFQVSTQTFGSLVEVLKSTRYLTVTPPLHLKSLGAPKNCLILLSEDNLGVYLHKGKGSNDVIQVLNCLSGNMETVDVNVLAAKTGDQRDDQSFFTTRTPKEAILVLIDTSSSMEEECYTNAGIKKINAVKELFYNFASRSMAYDFQHVIGLVRFDTMVKTLHTFTENLEKFKEHIRTLEPNGCTLLYDALRRGVMELNKVKTKFPDCRRRIICLTDGIDSGSSIEPVAVTVKLLESDIVVDSVLLGNVQNNMLHGISNATGGCCFNPQTTKEGLRLFEIETVLSLEQRESKKRLDPSSITEVALTNIFETYGYDEYPETSLPSLIKTKVTVTESALKKKIQESRDGRFMEKDKRILEELKSLHCDPHPFFRVFPSESEFTFWRILMQGPPDTPYEKGVFELYCQFGPTYPVQPPLVRFVTQIYHCNVNSVGRICHNIFDRCYNALITMRDIFDAVYGLLIIPEPDDPLDSILAEEFLSNRETYERAARKHTEEAAGKSLDDMEKKLVDHLPQFFPQHLVCPLTKKLFVDPVKTVYGTVYERNAIEEHLKQHQYEPLAGPGHDLALGDITPDWNMKKMVTDYRSRQIQ